MHTRIEHPERLSPEDLDDYLSRGWYRIGQAMVTCRFVWDHDRVLRSAIWTRTPVQDHVRSRSQRKLMRRNLSRYVVREGLLRPDGEHEALYRKYLKTARGERPQRLVDALLGGHVYDRFETHELSIRDEEGRLVGFSAFDLGHEGLQSIMAVYDPKARSDSLGFWTLLLEVDLARDRGLQYHYSGYILPGDPSMDYKLRVSPMEFLHPDEERWLPWEHFADVTLPVERLERRLRAMVQALRARGIPCEVADYHPYEAPVWNPDLKRALAHPRVVRLVEPTTRPLLDVIAWDMEDEEYLLVRCLRAQARGEPRGDEPPRSIELWVEAEREGVGVDPDEIANRLAGGSR
ncbi:MAG: hypothetical protein EA397_10955 [Deltaproteobacteria bacterium]|nr:MAG: hypothetical protein EA397_10955 [Deltaproteobacteria bacterium]